MIPVLTFLAAFGISLALTPLVRLLALRLGIVDHPERRKMHQVPVPRLGGGSIVLSFLLVTAGLWVWAPGLLGEGIEKLPVLLAAVIGISLLGLYDDWKGTNPWVKFVVQFAAAGLLVLAGVKANLFTNPLGGSVELGWLGIPVTLLWVVGVTNAMNLIDGLDGLASGIGAIASLALCAVAAMSDVPLVAFLSLALAGASLGFLPFNSYPARIFLGDTGSMFLGFTLASLGVVGSLKATTAAVLILPIVVLGVPVFDTLWAILRRTQRRVSPFKPDRDHIHHRLVRVGLHHRQVVLLLYFACLFLGVSASVIVQLPRQMGLLFVLMIAFGGITSLWTLKYIEIHLQERLAEAAPAGPAARTTPPPETGWALGQVSSSGRHSNGSDFQVAVCEVGRFRAGLAVSNSFSAVAEEVRQTLGRRIRVHAVGAYMLEDDTLLLVLKTERLSPDKHALVQEGLMRFFEEQAERWGQPGDFPVLRWVRCGSAGASEAVSRVQAAPR